MPSARVSTTSVGFRSGTLIVIGPRPRIRSAHAAVLNQAEALSLEILEVERPASVPLDDLRVRNALFLEALLPPAQGLVVGNAQPRTRDAVRAPLFRCHSP